MTELLLDNIYLIIFLPLWNFLIIMIGRFLSIYINKNLIYFLTLFSSFLGAIFCGTSLLKLPNEAILEKTFHFIKINNFIIEAGLSADKISLIFALTLFIISFFVQLFSIRYLEKEKKNYKFYAFMNLFNFSMASFFFSPNLFQLYFFWELAGLASYFLIGFEFAKLENSLASKKVFIINRIGDTALITGIIICSYLIYTYASNKSLTTLSFIDMNTISTILYAYAPSPCFEIICSLFLIAALVKSAQFPFFTWLQDAMVAKLPVSALLHSSTLVAAGIFLTLKILPFYTLENSLLLSIITLGIITTLICSLSACSQNNSKKVLAYSTSAQLGLIYFAIGILNIKAAVILYISHALIKSLLFLTLPQKNSNLNYLSFIILLITSFSLSGINFSGLIAKEYLATSLDLKYTIFISSLSFLTTFYIIRLALKIYDSHKLEKFNIINFEVISCLSLFLLNIALYIQLNKTIQYKITAPFWTAIVALIFVYILHTKKLFRKIPILYPLTLNGFYIDKFYTKICPKIYYKFSKFCKSIDIKINNIYQILCKFIKICVKLSNYIETQIFNKIVYLIKNIFNNFSIIDSKIQNGSIQNYNTYAFIIITLIISSVVLGYISILTYMGG